MRCGRPRCAAPTGGTASPTVGDRKGRPYGVSPRRFRPAHPGGRALQKGSPPERAGEDTRPYGGCGSVLSFRRGRTRAGPREGHTPGWLLSAFGRFTFSPSPTVLKKLFRNWVGESLGAPAVNYLGPKVALIRLAYARHLLPGREKAFGRLIAAPTNRGERF